MTLKEPGLTALRFSYVAVRTPLDLLNDQVVARAFGADSTAHRSLTHGLHTVDSLAAKVFASCAADQAEVDADVEDETESEPLIEVPSVADEPVATEVRETEAIARDEQQEISDLANRYLEEQQYQNLSGELAEDDEVRRAQAEIRAKQTIEDEHGQL